MKDVRVSIRLTDDEHRRFKIFATKQNLKMQEIIRAYISKVIEEDSLCKTE